MEHEDDDEEVKAVFTTINVNGDNLPSLRKRLSCWFFTGWFALCQFGPFVDCFHHGDLG